MTAADMACLRWQDRRHSWRHTSEGGFDPGRYGVDVVSQPAAKKYVERHHYSGSLGADRLRYGLFDLAGETPELCGVAVLSLPQGSEAALTNVFPRLVPRTESLELGRLVLADKVPANGEKRLFRKLTRLDHLE